MSNISSIDDLLMGIGNSQQPATPEHKEKIQEEKEPIEEMEKDESEKPENEPNHDDDYEDDTPDLAAESESNDESEEKSEKPEKDEDYDEDEYGNKKERMSPGVKERLERKEKQFQREIEQRDQELQILRQQLANQGANRDVQQAVKDFKYNPDDEGAWEQQLSHFVKQTVNNMQTEEHQKIREQYEARAQREFQVKFTQGMTRFDDFREVVGKQPIDDAMTISLRGMSDPTAFIYAASKRHPQELERISKLRDPTVKAVEMGKLEERMRRNKPITKTPRPLGRTKEDSTAKVTPKQQDTSGDDLLAKADAKRLATVRSRHKSNR